VCIRRILRKKMFTLVHVFGQRVTAVQLDEVHVPFGERERVQFERSQYAWIPGAREVTVVLVDTELQSSGVDLQVTNSGNTTVSFDYRLRRPVRFCRSSGLNPTGRPVRANSLREVTGTAGIVPNYVRFRRSFSAPF